MPGPQPTSRIDRARREVRDEVGGGVLDGAPAVRAQHRFVMAVGVAGRLRVGHCGVGYGAVTAAPTSEDGSSTDSSRCSTRSPRTSTSAARSAPPCACTSTAGPVVDLWGGLADATTGRPWESDTVMLVYSSTKGVTSVCANLLIERGRLDPDATRRASTGPSSRANGKDAITVAQVLSHQAGLPLVEGDFTLDEALAWDPMVQALAAQAPIWEPGTQHGYHMRTFGWLVGELVRRVDGRTIGSVLARRDREPLGLDFWIGLPEEIEPRVARLVPPEARPRRAVEEARRGPAARRRCSRTRAALRLQRDVEHAGAARGRAAVVERHRRRPVAGAAVRVVHRRGRRRAHACSRRPSPPRRSSRRAARTRC